MLSNDDRRAIEGLFSRLRDVEYRTDPRDPEAEAIIRDGIARQPGAPYYMAQTILMQEHALEVAERRIRELEESQRSGRGLVREDQDEGRGGPWDRRDRYDRGGGFLATAAQTALGVTGGILLGNALAGMFGGGGGTATAAEPAPQPEPEADTGAEGGDDFDFGGDGFDFGGDF